MTLRQFQAFSASFSRSAERLVPLPADAAILCRTPIL